MVSVVNYLLTREPLLVASTQNYRSTLNYEVKGISFAAAGASKGKMEAVLTAKSKIQLGRHEVGKLSFVLLDLTHINTTLSSQGALPIEGIIGADFLKKNKVVVDYRNRKLWL